MLVIGTDPGAFGALARLDTGGRRPELSVFDMPTLLVKVGKTLRPRVDRDGVMSLVSALCADDPDFSVIEKVQGWGGQNAAAAFVFGGAECALDMAFIAARCPRRFVPPEKWKRELGIAADKAAALVEAARLFPDHLSLFRPVRGELTKEQCIGRAEAALIAYYGATKL